MRVDGASATASPTASPVSGSDIGATERSGGITLRVNNVRSASAIHYAGRTSSPITPGGRPRTVQAKQGGSYVFVDTRVTNDSKGALDLTCGEPIDAHAIDEQGRKFTPDDGLYELAKNPECNEALQPGFKAAMTWAFPVPRGAHVVGFEFADTTDPSKPIDPTTVKLPPTP